MKQILVFLTAMGLMYLIASFINLTFDFSSWDQNSRGVYGCVSPILSFLCILIYNETHEKEVIVRDPKTGRFKKC